MIEKIPDLLKKTPKPILYTACVLAIIVITSISLSVIIRGTQELEGVEHLIFHQIQQQKREIETDIAQTEASNDYTPEQKQKIVGKLQKDLQQVESIPAGRLAVAINQLKIKRSGSYPEIFMIFLYEDDITVLPIKGTKLRKE